MKKFLDFKNFKWNKESAFIIILGRNFMPCCCLACLRFFNSRFCEGRRRAASGNSGFQMEEMLPRILLRRR